MCLVISGVFCYLAYSFFLDGDMVSGTVNGVIALFLLLLLIRNILKTKKEKQLINLRHSDYKFN